MSYYIPIILWQNTVHFKTLGDIKTWAVRLKELGGGEGLAAETITALVKLKHMSNSSIWNMHRLWK